MHCYYAPLTNHNIKVVIVTNHDRINYCTVKNVHEFLNMRLTQCQGARKTFNIKGDNYNSIALCTVLREKMMTVCLK